MTRAAIQILRLLAKLHRWLPARATDAAEVWLLGEIGPGAAQSGPRPFMDGLIELNDRIDQACERAGHIGLTTGIATFDSTVGGLFPGELVVLAARTSVGKTALACNIAERAAVANRLVYFASLEMSLADLTTRIVCGRAGVDSRRVRTGRLTPEERRSIGRASNELGGAALVIQDKPGATIHEIRRETRRLKRRGLQLVVIDYIGLISPADRRISRHEQIASITAAMKEMAKELDVPVLALAQLNREAENQRFPRLDNLRESGSIEQDADVVMLLHRTTDECGNGSQATSLIVAKNRSGPTVKIPLRWTPEYTRFEEAETVRQQEFA